MAKHRLAFTTPAITDTSAIEAELGGLDYELEVHVCVSSGEMIEAVKGADVVISWAIPMPREVIESIDSAQAIVNMGHGFDKIDREAASERGIMVVNTAGFVSEEVANHAIMLLLACARKLVVLDRSGEAWGLDGAPLWRTCCRCRGCTTRCWASSDWGI